MRCKPLLDLVKVVKWARNIVALSRAASLEGEGQELGEMHALAVVGALHQLIYGQLHQRGPDSLHEISDKVVRLAVAFLTVRMPPRAPGPRAPGAAAPRDSVIRDS